MTGVSTLRVELLWDAESHNWHFYVPALNISGGGQASREDAERASIAAIEYALEDDSEPEPGTEATRLSVTISAA